MTPIQKAISFMGSWLILFSGVIIMLFLASFFAVGFSFSAWQADALVQYKEGNSGTLGLFLFGAFILAGVVAVFLALLGGNKEKNSKE